MKARNPIYNENNTIDLEIEHETYGWIPFTASPEDVEEHGRDLYARAKAGEFGAIAEYVPYVPTTEQLADDIRYKRDKLIESVRWRVERHNDELALGAEPTEPLEPILQYIKDLRNVPQQTGFPHEFQWPPVPGIND